MRTEHLPECDKAWGYADAMCGRGIETADCWLCELLDRIRAEALREAREAVAGLPWKVAVSFGPIDCDESCEHGPCACSGVMRPEAWMTGPDDVKAAIDALGGTDG